MGNFTGTESIDFSTFKASFTANVIITNGTGRLTGAIGTGTFSGTFQLDPTNLSGQGLVFVNTSIAIPTTVPEPSTVLATVSVALGLGRLLVRRKSGGVAKTEKVVKVVSC